LKYQISESGSILPQQSNGVIGRVGYYIPAFTAKKDSSLLSFYGLRGENNREKMAKTFREPTTWLYYCNSIDEKNCTMPSTNSTARRYPSTDEEKASYFVPQLYEGHFRETEMHVCNTNNTECKGSVVGPSCSWNTHLENQMFWNEIHVESTGSHGPNNGYEYHHMMQIWRAANATNSDVLFWWWEPHYFVEKFAGSESAFQRVTLPTPSGECESYRSRDFLEEKCSLDNEVRRGKKIGSCDYPPIPLAKLLSRGLRTGSSTGTPVLQSPAYDFIMQIVVDHFSFWTLVNRLATIDEHTSGPMISREVVCHWVHENLDELLYQSPHDFPRQLETTKHVILSYICYCVSSFAAFASLVTLFLVIKWKDAQVLKAAQLCVLYIVVVGKQFVC